MTTTRSIQGFIAAHPSSRRTRRFVLLNTHHFGRDNAYVPVEDDVTLYLDQSAKQGTSRRSGYYYQERLTENLSRAKSFATKAGAEAYLVKHLTYYTYDESGRASCFTVVEKIVPASTEVSNAYYNSQKVGA